MYKEEINLNQTHIKLTTDIIKHELKSFINSLRLDLEKYINYDKNFLLSFEPLNDFDENLVPIVKLMIKSSNIADVGPMACVAGAISELSLDYLIRLGSYYSIIENGGDIALINNEKVLCGIYSTNPYLGEGLAFEIKSRSKPLGICSSSGRIGHSISFGLSDSVTVLSESSSLADGLATRIGNSVRGESAEERVSNGLEVSELYKDFFDGVLIVSDENLGTIGRLPKIIGTSVIQY